ncbi:unnamed protein product [Schistosoma bovis]|nr:unnamed protein product [Schistosoma bovis]
MGGHSALHVLFDKTLGNEPIPRPLDWDKLERINDVESGMAYFRQNEKLLQATINDIIQNQRKKRRAIKKYVKCKSEQQHEESFSLFLKVPDYSTLKDCFITQENILERQKSNSENEVCEPPGIFSEQVNYEFASKYMEHTLSLLQRMYNDF